MWTQTHTSLKAVLGLLALLPHYLDLADICKTQLKAAYGLKAFVVFGFNHYESYCRGIDDDIWRLFDDSRVQTFGSYSGVLSDMLKKHFRPVGVFYERLRPSASFDLPNVKPIDWLLLSRQADEGDSLSLHQPTWMCPACLTENQQEVCQKCYELMPGLAGWACGWCSSRNQQNDKLCVTCGSQRTHKCERCGGFYEGETCESCTETRNTCRQCRRPVQDTDLCSLCETTSTDLLDLNESCEFCGRALAGGNCPKCLQPCQDCGKVHTGGCLDPPSFSTASRCLRCGQSSRSCRCAEPPVSSASLCLLCSQPSQTCVHSTLFFGSSEKVGVGQKTLATCSLCRAALHLEKFCERCLQNYPLLTLSCITCGSSFICATCRQSRIRI